MRHEVLENGFEVVLKANHFSPTVAIQVWVGVGSLDEEPGERGMAHFLEHMLFKGTPRRAVGEIAATVELCGGEINAYTTFDHTVFHLTLAGPHAAVGIDLLADAFGHSLIEPEEFDREREVILEEIRRSADSPGARIGRRVFELAFAGTEAARPIIGSSESVSGFRRDDLHAFYRKWYIPANATLIVVGDVDEEEAMRLIRQSFGTLPRRPVPPRRPPAPSALPGPSGQEGDGLPAGAPVVSLIKGDFQQPRLEIIYPAPSLAHYDSAALDLAAFALGSGEMSRLNRRLRDGEGSVNSVGASVYSPLFGGLFETSCLLTEERFLDGVAGMAREVELLTSLEPVTAEELARARANLKADRVFRDETVDGQARSLGYGMLTPYKLLYDEVYTSMVEAMPVTAITGALGRWVRSASAKVVALVHESSELTEEQISAAFRRGVSEARQRLEGAEVRRRAGGLAAARPKAERPEAEVVQLSRGVRLVYRQNPQGQIFALTAATEGGLRGETEATAGVFNALSGMLACASSGRSFEETMQAVEGMGASLEGFSGKDSMGLHLQCLPEFMTPMLGLFRDALLSPVFPEVQWLSLEREIEQALLAQDDSPSGICLRRFQELMYGGHPYRHAVVGTKESVAHFSAEGLLKAFLKHRDSGPWVLAATGPLPVEVIVQELKSALAGFDPAPASRVFASDALIRQAEGASLRVAKEREQAHIVFGFGGLTWGDRDRAALDVLVNVLGGHGGRLFTTLRDRDSLAYTVSPLISYGRHPGIVGSYIACAPAKAERALAALRYEMMALTQAEPAAEEMERAVNHIIGSHDMGLQKSDAQTSTMALMELYGYGFDDFLRYPQTIQAVTAADVKRVACRLFETDRAVSVVVGPE